MVEKINAADETFTVKWEDPDGGDAESEIPAYDMRYPQIPIEELEMGKMYKGKVHKIHRSGRFAFIDIGSTSEGFLLMKMAGKDIKRDLDLSYYLYEGQEVKAWVQDKKPEEGKFSVTLNEKADLTPFIEAVANKPDALYPATVKAVIDGLGAFVEVKLPTGETAESLVHISQISDTFIADIHEHIQEEQEVQVRIINVDPATGKMKLTMRSGTPSDSKPLPDLSAFASIDPETWLKAKVDDVRSFGAFVTVTAEDGAQARGMVHVSQVRDGFVENMEDELERGQEVSVRVQSVDTERGRMALSMKKESSGFGGGGGAREPVDLTPFEAIPSDQWLKGVVNSITGFGAFVDVTTPDGSATANGMVHITEIKHGYVESVEQELEVGQEVDVWVKAIENGKLGLSMKFGDGEEEGGEEGQQAEEFD